MHDILHPVKSFSHLRLAIDPQTLTWHSGLLIRGLAMLPVSF
jgi:hypothetical protein